MFEIVNEVEEIKELDTINELLNFVVIKEKLENCLFNIILVDNDYIHKLNKEYRGIDRVTDVISFALEDSQDEVKLDFRVLGDIYISVDKAKDKAPEQSFWIGSLESESAKKMVEFSYSMQEQLAQQELDRLSSVAQMDFDAEKEQIMKDFFTEILMMSERKTKDEAITQSPIVRLEYLKTKYP